jgi:20S proteasome alpha/beta subunit
MYKNLHTSKIIMTYILGARCADGVVMIADKKITKDSGVDFEYSDKLFCDHEQMTELVILIQGGYACPNINSP